jgi:hypothetical protein
LPNCRNKRRDDIAIAIAEGDDLIALDLLVPAETDVVAALLRRCRRTVAVDDGCIEEVLLIKRRHRACKNGVKTAIRLPLPKRAINPRVMNFRAALSSFFNRQFFPLTPEIEHLQDIVEDRMHGEFGRWASAWGGKMGQDKLLELLKTQFRWNRLPLLAFRHFAPQIN